MAVVICQKCSAEFDAPARFCRRCGNTLGGAGEPSIGPSEATTRSFDYPAEQNALEASRTAPANQWPTGPAYIGPEQIAVGPQYPPYPAASTQGLAQKRSKAPFVIVGVLVFVLVAVVAALSLLMYQVVYRGSPSSQAPPSADNAPPPPAVPGVPGNPEIPVPPGHPAPPEGTTGTMTPTLASLIYPGSKQSMNIHGDGEGTMVLSTPDSSTKVEEWYVAKLPNAEVVSIPFVGGGVITKDQITVTITPGSPTTIVLAIEKKRK